MKQFSISCVILLVGSFGMSIRSGAQTPDSTRKHSAAHWARARTIDVKHVAIDLRFDWSKKQAYATTTITLSPLSSTNKIALDAGMLTINSITVPNGTPLKFTYDGSDKDDGLVITLDRVYPPNEDLTIRIDYHTNWTSLSDPNSLSGTGGKGLRFFGPTSTEPMRRRQIWSIGEPESNRYWFPCYDAPNDFRTTEFTATTDKALTVVSNGTLSETKDNDDGTHTFHYTATTPYANHLTSFVVSEYVAIKQRFGDVPLNNYSYPDEVVAATASVAQLPEMVKYFSRVTGTPYPFPVYSQAFVQDLPWGNTGYGVATETENMVDDDRTHDDFLYLWDDLEGESLAQQWFGSYVAPRDWSHAWLTKGFGRYFAELYDENKNGSDELHLYSRAWDRNSGYLATWNSGYRHPIVTNHYDDASTFVTDSYAGFHGAEVLHMLRKHLGDSTWWKAIRIYLKANAGKPVTTDDFRKAVEEASGEPMDWFFDQWVYKMGHPVFTVTKNYDAGKKQLILTVRQTQKVDQKEGYPEVLLFHGKLNIEIDGKIEPVWLEPKEENVFTFASAQEPRLVNFDYENTWVKELTFEKSLGELIYQLENGKDITGRRWAMSELVKQAKNEKTSSENKARISAAFRNVISGNSYWRFRWQAISLLQSILAPTGQSTPAQIDEATTKTLLSVIKNDKAWVRAAAIAFLGMTRDNKYVALYLNALNDPSDRVISAAAFALGQSKSPKAFPALEKLVSKPSWKNQSLLSALFGLRELGDPRGYDIAYKALSDLRSPHWVLAVPVWDYRIIAAQTIASLGKSSEAYPLLETGFNKAMDADDIHGIFYNVLLITELADPRSQSIFDRVRAKYKDDANAIAAVDQYEAQFKATINPN